MLIIYYARTDTLDLTKKYMLSAYRKERLRVQNADSKIREGIGAELLLNHALREYRWDYPLPAAIYPTESGKPMLAGNEVYFNLSHSKGYAACALADCEVGLDIQGKEPCHPKVIMRCFTKKEADYILGHSDPDYAFTKLWCMKECFGKSLGNGLQVGFSSFDAMDIKGIIHTTINQLHLAVYVRNQDKQKIDRIEEITLPGCES